MALKDHYDNFNEMKADILHEMREYLVEHGWVQGAWKNDDGVCFMGALDSVLCGDAHMGTSTRSRKQIRETLGYQLDYVRNQLIEETVRFIGDGREDIMQIPAWNDKPGRTFEEVEKFILQRADYYETRYLEGLQS